MASEGEGRPSRIKKMVDILPHHSGFKELFAYHAHLDPGSCTGGAGGTRRIGLPGGNYETYCDLVQIYKSIPSPNYHNIQPLPRKVWRHLAQQVTSTARKQLGKCATSPGVEAEIIDVYTIMGALHRGEVPPTGVTVPVMVDKVTLPSERYGDIQANMAYIAITSPKKPLAILPMVALERDLFLSHIDESGKLQPQNIAVLMLFSFNISLDFLRFLCFSRFVC